MNPPLGRKLVKVVRLAWYQPDQPVDFGVGPVQLVFDDGRGLVLAGRSDWALEILETEPGDTSWLSTYDYDYDGAHWVSRDASTESPFAPVIARRLGALRPICNEIGAMTGLALDFAGEVLTVRMWEGEVKIDEDRPNGRGIRSCRRPCAAALNTEVLSSLT